MMHGHSNDSILVFLSFHMATTSIYTRIFSNQTFFKCEKALEGDQL